jgi:acetyl esterase
MPLDPFLEPLVASLPPFPDKIEDFDAFRAQERATVDALTAQLIEPGPAIKSKDTLRIPVEGGEITLNIFHPFTDGPHPVHLYLHGGGWIGGSIHVEAIDILCQERVVAADCVAVSVEYRKAPEHPFPTALNDTYAALLWVFDHAEELGIRPDIISVGGGSAGANLAAALTLKVRDEGGPALAFQLLEVPALDFTMQSPSIRRYASGYGLDLHTIQTLIPLYLPSPKEQVTNPYVSPLLAPDLSGLPPAYIMASEYDPLCDDGERYAERLNKAGVHADFYLGHGHIHGSSSYTKVMPSAREWRDLALDALRRAHRQAMSRQAV